MIRCSNENTYYLVFNCKLFCAERQSSISELESLNLWILHLLYQWHQHSLSQTISDTDSHKLHFQNICLLAEPNFKPSNKSIFYLPIQISQCTDTWVLWWTRKKYLISNPSYWRSNSSHDGTIDLLFIFRESSPLTDKNRFWSPHQY